MPAPTTAAAPPPTPMKNDIGYPVFVDLFFIFLFYALVSSCSIIFGRSSTLACPVKITYSRPVSH
jgi:hypothetical protein